VSISVLSSATFVWLDNTSSLTAQTYVQMSQSMPLFDGTFFHNEWGMLNNEEVGFRFIQMELKP
jgi:hypothetical protein